MLVNEIFIDPRRILVHQQSTIDNFIEIFNGKKHIYQTLYYYVDEPKVNKVLVDKIYLDFDAKDDGFFEDTKTVAKYLYDRDIMFYIRFSGRGFHIFIMLDKKWLKNPKIAIKQYVQSLHQKTNTKSDSSVVGDLRRVVRVPNTINIKSHKYCIAITYDTLMNCTYDQICDLASNKGPLYDYYNGYKLLDISGWDKEISVSNGKTFNINVKSDLITNDIPPCVKKMMENPVLGWRYRAFVIVCLRDLGYTEEEIESILYSFLTEEKFNHSMNDERQLDRYMNDETFLFPNCETLNEEGWCVNENCNGHNLYY